MEELNIKVTKMTADALRKSAEQASIEVGEVVDRYVLNVAPDDPDKAFILAMEHYLICVSRLSEEGSAQVFGKVCGLFLGSIPPEDLDEMVASVKSTRNWEDPASEPVTEEERAAYRKEVQDMVQAGQSEHVRTILYSLLHG